MKRNRYPGEILLKGFIKLLNLNSNQLADLFDVPLQRYYFAKKSMVLIPKKGIKNSLLFPTDAAQPSQVKRDKLSLI